MIKILVCDFYLNKLQVKCEENNTRMKYLTTFFADVKMKLDKLVKIFIKLGGCAYQRLGSFEICSYCINFQYILNVSMYKVYFERKKILNGYEIKPLTDYLNENLLVDLFFVFNILRQKTETKLDNPSYCHTFQNVKVVSSLFFRLFS